MNLRELIGDITPETKRQRQARVHQGWWRAFVLGQKQGPRPNNPSEKICNTLNADVAGLANFVSKEIGELAMNTAKEHGNAGANKAGIIQVDRLKTNLLSSQPLCFNFFGLFALDHSLGLRVIKTFFPEVTGLRDVRFEYAPTPRSSFTDDNSAFDVVFEVEAGDAIGLIGVECKYTEPFSPKEYRTIRYKQLYDASQNFNASYDALTDSAFNQLFRNQIIAEALLQSDTYDFVKTALFCSPDDADAKRVGARFSQMLKSGFTVFDYFELIAAMQKLELTEPQRNISMLLWARYIALDLSKMAFQQYESAVHLTKTEA